MKVLKTRELLDQHIVDQISKTKINSILFSNVDVRQYIFFHELAFTIPAEISISLGTGFLSIPYE